MAPQRRRKSRSRKRLLRGGVFNDTNVYRKVIRDLVDKYVDSNQPIQNLAKFDAETVKQEYYSHQELDIVDHGIETSVAKDIANAVLSFMRAVVLQYTTLSNGGALDTSLCDLTLWPNFCNLIGEPKNYKRWTWAILYLVNLLRVKQFPKVPASRPVTSFLSGLLTGYIRVATVPIDESCTPEFISQATLMLHMLLLWRLHSVMDMLARPSANRYLTSQGQMDRIPFDRLEVEGCMFACVASFYQSYYTFQSGYMKKNYPILASAWTTASGQVSSYINPQNNDYTFQMTKLPLEDLRDYFSQDAILDVYKCVNTKYLYISANKQCLYDQEQRDLVQPSTAALLTAVAALDISSIYFRMKQWMRFTFWKLVRDPIGIVANAYVIGTVFPSFASAALAASPSLLVGLFAFTKENQTLVLATSLAGSLWVNRTVATSFFFPKKVLKPRDPALQVLKATKVSYLVWERNANGVSVIYHETPLPAYDRVTFDNFYSGGGGMRLYGGAPPQRQQLKSTLDFKALKKAFEKGSIRTELPEDLQRYILEKCQFSDRLEPRNRMTGGAGDDFDKDICGLLGLEPKSYSLTDENGDTTQITEFAHSDSYAQLQLTDDETWGLFLPLPNVLTEALTEATKSDIDNDPSRSSQQEPVASPGGQSAVTEMPPVLPINVNGNTTSLSSFGTGSSNSNGAKIYFNNPTAPMSQLYHASQYKFNAADFERGYFHPTSSTSVQRRHRSKSRGRRSKRK